MESGSLRAGGCKAVAKPTESKPKQPGFASQSSPKRTQSSSASLAICSYSVIFDAKLLPRGKHGREEKALKWGLLRVSVYVYTWMCERLLLYLLLCLFMKWSLDDLSVIPAFFLKAVKQNLCPHVVDVFAFIF